MVWQEVMQTMRRDTHLVKKILGRLNVFQTHGHCDSNVGRDIFGFDSTVANAEQVHQQEG